MTTPGFTAEASLARGAPRRVVGSPCEVAIDAVEPAGPLAYAACVALCAWWLGPACFVACIPLFVAPGP